MDKRKLLRFDSVQIIPGMFLKNIEKQFAMRIRITLQIEFYEEHTYLTDFGICDIHVCSNQNTKANNRPIEVPRPG